MSNGIRNFEAVGTDAFKIAEILLSDQEICKLLYYMDADPLSHSDFEDTLFLLNKNIRVVPKIPDYEEKGSFIIISFDNFYLSNNIEFKVNNIQFDIVCPIDKWNMNDKMLRPFKIMSKIDALFNNKTLSGIGKLTFHSASSIVLTTELVGYNLNYTNYNFN